jgi:hypothetical protein
MAASADNNLERFKGENHSAFILGYTGEVGKALVRVLAETKAFTKVVLVGRRTVSLDPGVGGEFVSTWWGGSQSRSTQGWEGNL